MAGTLNHATTPSYSLTLTATDAHGGTATTTVTVTVIDVPSKPAFGAASYAFTLAEDTAVTTTVGTLRATLAGGATVTHTLTAGNTGGVFALDGTTGALTLAAALDYETTPSYHLIVEARSGPAAATAVPVTITVTDVDEPPAFTAEPYAFSVAEDSTFPAAVGTVTAVDPDGHEVAYDLTAGNTGDIFAVHASAGRLVLRGQLDYETTPSYTLTLQASSSGVEVTTTVTITVTPAS